MRLRIPIVGNHSGSQYRVAYSPRRSRFLSEGKARLLNTSNDDQLPEFGALALRLASMGDVNSVRLYVMENMAVPGWRLWRLA